MIPPFNSRLQTLEQFVARHARPSSALQLSILLLLASTLCSAPFLEVELAVRAEGSFRPLVEKQELRARLSGFMDAVLVGDNQQVAVGECLFRMRSPLLEENRRHLTDRMQQEERDLRDLECLLSTDGQQDSNISLADGMQPVWMQEWEVYRTGLGELVLKRDQAASDWARTVKLLQERLISQAEAEIHEHEKNRSIAVVSAHRETQFLKWRSQLEEKRRTLEGLTSESKRLANEFELLCIRAPIQGVVEQIRGVSPGTHLQAGDFLAGLSPEAGLRAELFVDTRDVARVSIGQQVRMQVDAFPYTEWGWLEGVVESMAGDAVVVAGRARFRVLVVPRQQEMTLRTGVRGLVQRGMSVHGRFLGVKRPVWRLLLDRAAAWWEPGSV